MIVKKNTGIYFLSCSRPFTIFQVELFTQGVVFFILQITVFAKYPSWFGSWYIKMQNIFFCGFKIIFIYTLRMNLCNSANLAITR